MPCCHVSKTRKTGPAFGKQGTTAMNKTKRECDNHNAALGRTVGLAHSVLRRLSKRFGSNTQNLEVRPFYNYAFAPARLFWRLFTKSSTTAGSASVDVSPRLEKSSSAILRRMRRMILPERVLGSPGENWIRSGVASGPISFLTCWTSSFFSSSLG